MVVDTTIVLVVSRSLELSAYVYIMHIFDGKMRKVKVNIYNILVVKMNSSIYKYSVSLTIKCI